MSDHPFKDLEDKENERRKAIGLPPLPPETWRPELAKRPLPKPFQKGARKEFADYSMSDVDENVREHRELKKNKYSGERLEKYMESYKIGLMRRIEAAIVARGGELKPTDSLVVSDKNGLKSVPVKDMQGAPQQEVQDPAKLLESIRERMYTASSRGTFKDRFPSITKLVNMFATKQGDEKKEKIRQTEDLRKQAEQNQNVGVALERLAREQEISVKLLRRLLAVVRQRRGGGGLFGSQGQGGEQGGPSRLSSMLYGGLALGAAVSIGAQMLGSGAGVASTQQADTPATIVPDAAIANVEVPGPVPVVQDPVVPAEVAPPPGTQVSSDGTDVDQLGLIPEVVPAPVPRAAPVLGTDAMAAAPYGADTSSLGLEPVSPAPAAAAAAAPAPTPAATRADTQRLVRAYVERDRQPDRYEEVINHLQQLYPRGIPNNDMLVESRIRDYLRANPGTRQAIPVESETARNAEDLTGNFASTDVAAEVQPSPPPPVAAPVTRTEVSATATAATTRSDTERLVRAFVERERQPNRYQEVIDHLQQLYPRGIPRNNMIVESRIRDYLIANPGTRQAIPVEPENAPNAEDLTGNFQNVSSQTTTPLPAPAPTPPPTVVAQEPATPAARTAPRIDSGIQSRITAPRPASNLGAGSELGASLAGSADVGSMGLEPQAPTATPTPPTSTVASGTERLVRAFVERERQPDRYEEVINHLQQLYPRGIPTNDMLVESRIRDYLTANPGTRQAIPVESDTAVNAEDLTGNFTRVEPQAQSSQPETDVTPQQRVSAETLTPSVAATTTGVEGAAEQIVRAIVDREREPNRYEEVISHLRQLYPSGIPNNSLVIESRIRDYMRANPGAKESVRTSPDDNRDVEDLRASFTNRISNRESAFGGVKEENLPKTTEAVVSEAVTKQEMLSKELENRPDMFSNRTLMIRARNVKFKGDEIEFQQPDAVPQKVGGEAPGAGAFGGGGSSFAQMFSGGAGGSAAMEGSGGAGAPADAAATKDLKFAPGVDKRIQKDIAEKVKETENASGKSLTITSGFRDPTRNAAAGGARNSAHTSGKAVDIQFRGNVEDTVNLIQKASASGIGGIGVYRPGFVHLDTGPKRVWGPDYTARSIPDWAKEALNAHMTGQRPEQQAAAADIGGAEAAAAAPVSGGGESAAPAPSEAAATPAPAAPTTGVEVAQASVQNEVASRTPEPPTVAEMSVDSGGATPSLQNPMYSHSMNDPGPVEPADAAQRYAMLFNMAA